jgi:UTP--glucose-1-phosphate uridylyltransferase
VFEAFHRSGLLQSFIDQGKEYVFISNIENPGGTVGTQTFRLLHEVFSKHPEFLIEVTERIATDHLGGILVSDKEKKLVRMLELSSVPHDKLKLFKGSEFHYWNTNR